ncbi:hypothetical protein BW723_00600 [Polaribacter reichenbachii]|uniref:Uncharacterized protein n=1 Tax=Polaribacter reichenbachii TaxID=996801 RepID=A0A1B8U4R9_9FLAO|nr:hypothetical protein [Polaribacter reichenbachii]APZ44875.1 hypothetical protein BW723_00600 [Polaribacter reichenbachii]AUC18739.1 hypothetical protein BTO17_08605 [Polaribacter reichenbachii]OBY66853.1 hypothetical protein LPB301_05345 [Polaribacter reichenbachii]
MEKSTENNNKPNFLKEGLQGDISKHHKEYLGTTIPKDYFAQSKISILDKIKEEARLEEEPKKQMVFYLQPQFKYIAAATLVFILSLTVWLQNSNNANVIIETNLEELTFSDDVLINSLLIEDSEIDAFTDATLFNEIVVKAELTEQKMDNLILNSLIVEDSLLDNYIDYELLETIIL